MGEERRRAGWHLPRVGRVIHVVADRVQTRRAGTAVLARGTARRALALLRRVVAVIARVAGRARVVLGGRASQSVGRSEPIHSFILFLETSTTAIGIVVRGDGEKEERGRRERWRERWREKEEREREKKKREKNDETDLKSMQQAEPMPHLMHGRLPQIVPEGRDRGLGHAAREHVAPVGGVVQGRVLERQPGRARVRDGGRQGAVAEQGGGGRVGVGGGREVGLEVEVQGLVAAAAEGALHRGRGGVRGPGVVDGPGRRDEFEGDAGGAVEAGEDGDLAGLSIHKESGE